MCNVYQELEHLRQLSYTDEEKRFNKLYKLLHKPEFLVEAWLKIKGNKGSRTPGIDGQTRDDVDMERIHQVSAALKDCSYRPKPLRRAYIPKKNGKRRPLGIPVIQDRLVQAGVAMILEALYEPHFRACSNGFRPRRSTISALRQVAYSYRSGADWVIEGDIKSCFDAIPHHVILNLLRKRIRDERFIALIGRFLKSGVMEEGKLRNTYSGTPQGGVVSPILANIVLHEFDVWLEDAIGANPPQKDKTTYHQRMSPEYKRLTQKIAYQSEMLREGPPYPHGRTAKEIVAERKRLKAERRKVLPTARDRNIRYVRYADDFLVILSRMTEEDAILLKQQIGAWLQDNLGLTLSEEKTLITHVSQKIRFLGYDIEAIRNPNGTRWARLMIPKEAEQAVKEKLKQATRYVQAPELDVFGNVNAVARGWCNYYRYAYNAPSTFGRLTTVVFHLTMNYLTKRHRCSRRKMMYRCYKRDPKTNKKALSTINPGNEKRLFIWNAYPKRVSILTHNGHAQDTKPNLFHAWASGHSRAKRAELLAKVGEKCEVCGSTTPPFFRHHPKRLRNTSDVMGRIHSGYEQRGKLLCADCHQSHHHGDTSRK